MLKRLVGAGIGVPSESQTGELYYPYPVRPVPHADELAIPISGISSHISKGRLPNPRGRNLFRLGGGRAALDLVGIQVVGDRELLITPSSADSVEKSEMVVGEGGLIVAHEDSFSLCAISTLCPWRAEQLRAEGHFVHEIREGQYLSQFPPVKFRVDSMDAESGTAVGVQTTPAW